MFSVFFMQYYTKVMQLDRMQTEVYNNTREVNFIIQVNIPEEKNGVSAAQITLVPNTDVSRRIGIAKGQIKLSEDFDEGFDALDETIAELFENGGEL